MGLLKKETLIRLQFPKKNSLESDTGVLKKKAPSIPFTSAILYYIILVMVCTSRTKTRERITLAQDKQRKFLAFTAFQIRDLGVGAPPTLAPQHVA